MSEGKAATRLQAIFDGAEDWEFLLRKKLARKLREVPAGPEAEVEQFRCLQAAVRESPALAAAFDTAGFESLATWDSRRIDPETGALIQAFNHLIEAGWTPG